DADRFGDRAGSILADFVTDNPSIRVWAAARSTRYERLHKSDELRKLRVLEFTIPNLEDQDIHLLIDALTRANRLGQLRGLKPDEQAALFREKCGRQLLVAMIEATSGRKFDEKIESECRDLGAET